MVLIRFTDPQAKRRALAYLAGRFSFKSWATGEMLVPEAALVELAIEQIHFAVEGAARYDQRVPALRDPSAAQVQ